MNENIITHDNVIFPVNVGVRIMSPPHPNHICIGRHILLLSQALIRYEKMKLIHFRQMNFSGFRQRKSLIKIDDISVAQNQTMGKDTHIPIFLHGLCNVGSLIEESVGLRLWSPQWVDLEDLAKFGYVCGLLQDIWEEVQGELIGFIPMPFPQVRYNVRKRGRDSLVAKE